MNQRKTTPVPLTAPRNCNHCGKLYNALLFKVRHGGHQYCSRSCADSYRHSKRRQDILRDYPLPTAPAGVKYITLGKPHVFTAVDESDYPVLSQINWIHTQHSNTSYACYAFRGDTGKYIRTYLHRFIFGLPPGIRGDNVVVDHKDRDGLNNTRDNLRVCSRFDNARNRIKPIKSTTSKYKGVFFCSTRKQWIVTVTVENRGRYIGQFVNEIEAAYAYDAAALRLFGEFARVNFPVQSLKG